MAEAGLKQKLFGFQGRLRRRDWWLLGLAAALVQVVVMLSIHLLVFGSGETFLGTLRWAGLVSLGVVLAWVWRESPFGWALGVLLLAPLAGLALKPRQAGFNRYGAAPA